MSLLKSLLILVLLLPTVASSYAAAKDKPLQSLRNGIVKPLEEAASTDEIVSGVEACRLALGEIGKFDPKVFENLSWLKGTSYPDEPRIEYYKLNLVNDVLIGTKVDGCFTKARLNNMSQIQGVRTKLIEKYRMKNFDQFDGFSPEKKAGMLAAVGPKIREVALFSDRFIIFIEPAALPNASYVSLTFAPII
jgi:hypothetical protein